MLSELEAGRLPIKAPESGKVEYYCSIFHHAKRAIFAKPSPEDTMGKAVEQVVSALIRDGYEVPKHMLSVSIGIHGIDLF